METLKEERIIEVGMGEMKISEVPGKLVTRGLGSCVGITLYDPEKKIGSLAHAMLPDVEKIKLKRNPNRFVNYVIIKMVEELEKRDCSRGRIVCKLFGGAHMFGFIARESVLNIGEKNVKMAEAVLEQLGIKIEAEEVGGTFGRTIELNLETGKVLMSTVSWGEKEV